MDKKMPYFLEDTSPLMEGRLTPGQLPIFRHGSILEGSGKALYTLLITQISKNASTDSSSFPIHS
jgi:hypothetical protein